MVNIFLIKLLTFLNIFLCFSILPTTNPIYSAFILIIIFLTSAFILLTLNIKFLSFVIIILYAGAISILFLFIIFTLNLKSQTSKIKLSLQSSLIIILSILKIISSLLISLFTNESSTAVSYQIFKSAAIINRIEFEWNEIEQIGNLFYSHYGLLFLLIGYILLLVMIGVVLISKTLNFNK